MEIGSVGNCMFSQVFNTIYIQEMTEASLYIGINAGLVEIEANQISWDRITDQSTWTIEAFKGGNMKEPIRRADSWKGWHV